MLDLPHIVQQSRHTADRLDMVLDATIAGQCSPDNAAKMAYLGISIAANNSMQINAARMSNEFGLPLSAPKGGNAWKGLTRPQ